MLSLSILTAGYSRPSSPEKRGEEQGKGRGMGGEGGGERTGGEHFQHISVFLDLDASTTLTRPTHLKE